MVYEAKLSKPQNVQVWWEGIPDPILMETAWERQMTTTGMERYENTRDAKNSADTSAGKKYLRKLSDLADEGIKELQRSLVNMARVDRSRKATLLIVPSDTLALISLKVMLNRSYSAAEHDVGYPLHTVVTDIGKAVELELNFRHWLQSSRESAAAYADVNGLANVPKSQAERLIEEQGATQRTLRRWQKAFAELNQYDWDVHEQHFCGDALVGAVVKALPDHFELHLNTRRQKRTKMLRMTGAFRKEFDDLEFSTARVQSIKKPMLSKPERWTKDEDR